MGLFSKLFGKKTEKAVKSFQKAEKLTADGIFGKKSLERAKIVKK
jgi:peptidoglycan hydrolase-like protein with peptidoglycan-binding domain